MNVAVVGRGPLADRLRAEVVSDVEARVIVVDVSSRPVAVTDLSDADIESIWERPMQEVIGALQDARRDRAERIVVVVPTLAMSGGAQYAVSSATAEAARILVKSAARQWGAAGITVNAVAVAPDDLAIDPSVAGPVSIAPRALTGPVSPVAAVSWLCSAAAGDVTGQTIVCDGGLWM